MKKNFLFVALCMFICINVQAQTEKIRKNPINSDLFYTISGANGLCLDIKNLDNETKIMQSKPNGTDTQLWKFKKEGEKGFRIISKANTNKCISVDDEQFMIIYDITDADQFFKTKNIAGASNKIKIIVTSNDMALSVKKEDTEGAAVYEVAANTSKMQSWTITPEGETITENPTGNPVVITPTVITPTVVTPTKPPIKNPTDNDSNNNGTNADITKNYYTINSKHSGLPLNIRSERVANEFDLYQDGDKNIRPSGKFKFISLGNNEYKIVVLNSQKYLQGGDNEGSPVILQEDNNNPKQVFILKNISGNEYKFVLKHSKRVMGVEAASTWHGTTMREYPENNATTEIFILGKQGVIKYEELVQNGNNLNTQRKFKEAIAAFDEAIALFPNDGYVYAQKGAVLQYGMDKITEATKAYQIADNKGYKDLGMFLQWGDCLWGSKVAENVIIQQKCIAEGKKRLAVANNDNEKNYIKEKMIMAYGNMACAYVNLGKLDEALEASKKAYELDAKSTNRNIAFAAGEVHQIRGGMKWQQKNYTEAERLINEALTWYQKGNIENRITQAKVVQNIINQTKAYQNTTPDYTQKILSMHIMSIDINQVLNGKQTNVKDVMLEGTILRNFAGQGWFMAQVMVWTKGKLTFEFKSERVGTGTSLWDGHPQVEPNSIKPSVAPLLFQHQNYDNYLFYWNGYTNGLNNGTGVGIYSWPLTLGGFEFGTVRGYSIMATNPEAYGIQDGLLHHEYGHLMEAHSGIGWVHCADVLKTDKDKPIYNSWDKNCDHIEEWFYSVAIKDKYKDMNWALQYPINVSQAQLDVMMAKINANATGAKAMSKGIPKNTENKAKPLYDTNKEGEILKNLSKTP